MVAKLLKDNDHILPLDIRYQIEIVDYLNMRERKLPTLGKWDKIKSFVVTKYGDTLWQISERYIDLLNARAIGTVESPVHLFEWIIKQSNDEQARRRRIG